MPTTRQPYQPHVAARWCSKDMILQSLQPNRDVVVKRLDPAVHGWLRPCGGGELRASRRPATRPHIPPF